MNIYLALTTYEESAGRLGFKSDPNNGLNCRLLIVGRAASKQAKCTDGLPWEDLEGTSSLVLEDGGDSSKFSLRGCSLSRACSSLHVRGYVVD